MKLEIQKLLVLLDQLTGPNGCPWSKSQTPKALCHYIIEETYEVIDAIQSEDLTNLEEELGDVLFAYLFTLHTAAQKYEISLNQVVDKVVSKIKRRHPHVFKNPGPITFEELRVQWEQIKAQERKEKGGEEKTSPIDSVAQSMPVVLRAMKFIELGVSHDFEYQADESTLSGRFMKLVMEGLDQFENLEEVFNEGVVDYQQKFKAHLASMQGEGNEKTGDSLTT